jgi:hypothetical protein
VEGERLEPEVCGRLVNDAADVTRDGVVDCLREVHVAVLWVGVQTQHGKTALVHVLVVAVVIIQCRDAVAQEFVTIDSHPGELSRGTATKAHLAVAWWFSFLFSFRFGHTLQPSHVGLGWHCRSCEGDGWMLLKTHNKSTFVTTVYRPEINTHLWA